MWYRIEVGKEGEILSCQEVEAALANGRNVRYVEADSKPRAIGLVQEWFRNRADRKRISDQHRNAGRCYCGQPREPGRVKCRACIDSNKAASARYKARKFAGADIPLLQAAASKTDAERAAVMERRLEWRKWMTRAGRRALLLEKLRETLVQFDKMTPRVFRAWLESEVRRLETADIRKRSVASELSPRRAIQHRPVAAE